jgi:hypothetical protein
VARLKPVEARRGQPLNEMPSTARAAARHGVTNVAGKGAPPMPQGLTKRMQTAWKRIVQDLTAAGIGVGHVAGSVSEQRPGRSR